VINLHVADDRFDAVASSVPLPLAGFHAFIFLVAKWIFVGVPELMETNRQTGRQVLKARLLHVKRAEFLLKDRQVDAILQS